MKKIKFSLKRISCVTANINALFLLVGYPLFTSLVFNASDTDLNVTRGYSVIYRGFALLIALLVIIFNIKKPFVNNRNINVYLLFWGLYSCRIICDLFMRSESYLIQPSVKSYLLQFVFGGVLIPTLAVFFSYRYLNLKFILFSAFYILIFVVTKGVVENLLNPAAIIRAQMNVAQSTLAFGTNGAVLCIAVYSIFQLKSHNLTTKIFLLSVFIVGFFAVLIAGSRGPFFGLIATLLMPLIVKKPKNILISVIFLLFVIIIFGNILLNLVQTISPYFYQRVVDTVVYGDLGGRESIFQQAINRIIEHPLFGDWFLLDMNDTTTIAHNALLEALMSIGIFGGLIFLYLYIYLIKYSIIVIKSKCICSFWGYTSILFIIYSMTTGGSIYIKPEYNFSFLILFFIISKKTYLPDKDFKT